jgi:LysM repeat protein
MMDVTRPTMVSQAMMQPKTQSNVARPMKVAIGLGVGAVILVALPVLIALSGYVYFQTADVILPGVRVGEVPLGRLTTHEAETELHRVWNVEYRITAVDIGDPSRAWVVEPSKFGLSVDVQASAAQAFSVGRGQGLIADITQMATAIWDGWDISPVVALDENVAEVELRTWNVILEEPPVEAVLALEGGSIVQTPGQIGTTLDVGESLGLLSANPSAVMLDYRFIPLVMKPVEPIIRDVSSAAGEAEALLASALSINAYDPVTDERFAWRPSREEIANWLDIEQDSSGFHVSIDEDRLSGFISTLEAGLGEERSFDHEKAMEAALNGLKNRPAEALLIYYRPTSYVVQAGDTTVSIGVKVGMPYWKLLEANPAVAARGLSVGEAIVIPPRDAMLVLSVVPDKRIVISISEQRMWVYEAGNLIREHIVSTGIARSPTLPGIFQVQSHFLNAYASIWDLYMPHFLGIYKATPDLLNGIHGLPLLSSGVRLWGNVLGRPASYGCIILDLDAASLLYDWAEDVVVVEIRR